MIVKGELPVPTSEYLKEPSPEPSSLSPSISSVSSLPASDSIPPSPHPRAFVPWGASRGHSYQARHGCGTRTFSPHFKWDSSERPEQHPLSPLLEKHVLMKAEKWRCKLEEKAQKIERKLQQRWLEQQEKAVHKAEKERRKLERLVHRAERHVDRKANRQERRDRRCTRRETRREPRRDRRDERNMDRLAESMNNLNLARAMLESTRTAPPPRVSPPPSLSMPVPMPHPAPLDPPPAYTPRAPSKDD